MHNITSMTASVDELRANLPIPFVLHVYGFQPADESHGRLHYRNPWRDDSTPSLDVFTDDKGVQRVGDFAEGFNGSVLDIIGRQLNTDNFQVISTEARRLYTLFLEEGWDGPTFVGVDTASKEMDPNLVEKILSARIAGASNSIVLDLIRDNPGVSHATLVEFSVRSTKGKLAIPYPDGRAIRFRHTEGKTFLAGSTPGLYHHPDEDLAAANNVLLVEGESDTWAAWPVWDGIVVGIPGVGHQPGKWMEQFEGKSVLIAFDGDAPGRAGALRWADALAAVNCDVRIVPVPDGRDIANLPRVELERLLTLSRSIVKNNTGMMKTSSGYAVEGRKEGEVRAVSNWTVEPVRILDFADTTPRAFEVQVKVEGDTVAGDNLMLTFEDMGSSKALHRWASQFSGSWWGGTTDHQKLRAVIEEQAAFLPVDTATSKPGLINETFVYPGGTIGDGSTVCVPDAQFPLSDESVYHFDPHTPTRGTLSKLLGMHTPEVMQPLLAWLAAAPLRSRYKQFPPAFVTGRAGSGKTTLVHEAVSIFSGINFVTNLTSTTPYALTLTMGGTNAYVTWFDEYRPGARKSTMEMMNQLLRDAYNGAPSRRGGMGSDKSVVTTIETTNPLLVSGEDFADEQSHRDRLIKIFVPRDGKGELPFWTEGDQAFAYDYLLWLTERQDGVGATRIAEPPQPNVTRYQEAGVTERQAYNLAILDVGWRLLRDYAYERESLTLGKPNWDHLLKVSQDEADSDPILEALLRLYETEGNDRGMWYSPEEDTFYVNAGIVLQELNRLDIPLPFQSSRAMSQYLIHDLGGKSIKRTSPLSAGTQIRYIALANPWADSVSSDS